MTDSDRQLVEAITAQVLAILRTQGGASASSVDAAARASIHPPVGVCTGDYSKFTELRGKLYDTGSAAPSSSPAVASTQSSPPSPSPRTDPMPLTGIVTASQLQSAIDANGGQALLAPDARLSPLANDLARKLGDKIRRATTTAGSTGAAASATNDAALPWLWWIDGACPVVQQVTHDRRSRLRLSGSSRSPAGLSAAVRELAGAIKSRQVAGGLLFVHNAARAACMANRCASVRAVVATCGEAVEQGIAELGANVLIIEYPHHGLRSASAMVDRVLQQPPRPPASVERDLVDLHRCG